MANNLANQNALTNQGNMMDEFSGEDGDFFCGHDDFIRTCPPGEAQSTTTV
jgi:hypothetical protein